MADKTSIEWTDASWPVVTGCDHVSPGCDNCYAAKLTGTRLRHLDAYAGLAENGRFNGKVRLLPERLDWPLKWKKPRKIFVSDMADLFHDAVLDEFIANVFGVMAACPDHTFQVLTKRHSRMRSLLRKWSPVTGRVPWVHTGPWPLPNVWLGVSVEDQKHAELRIPALLETPAAVRFISAEPLLGPVDLRHLKVRSRVIDALGGDVSDPRDGAVLCGTPSVLDWVIAGGESGPGARPMHPDWARSLRDQCVSAGVAFHFKQHGAWAPVGPLYGDSDEVDGAHMDAVHLEVDERRTVVQLERHGGIAEGYQPTDRRTWLMARVGKLRAGRELDGRTWDEFPAVAS